MLVVEYEDFIAPMMRRWGTKYHGAKRDQHKAVFEALVEKYGPPIGSGVHRSTFKSKRVVVKFPMTRQANIVNKKEVKMSKADGRKEIAKARLVYIKGFPVVLMEKVQPCENYNCIDAGKYDRQFGRAKDGKILAYDPVYLTNSRQIRESY